MAEAESRTGGSATSDGRTVVFETHGLGLLRASGVSAVFNLAGGIAAWQEAGLPVEAGASREELVSAG